MERRRRIRFMVRGGLKRLKRLKGLKRLKRNFRSSLSSCNSRPRRVFYGGAEKWRLDRNAVGEQPRGRDWSGCGEPRSFQFHRRQNLCNHPLWKWRFTSKSRTVESTVRRSSICGTRRPATPSRSTAPEEDDEDAPEEKSEQSAAEDDAEQESDKPPDGMVGRGGVLRGLRDRRAIIRLRVRT